MKKRFILLTLILLFAANWLVLQFVPIINIWLSSIVRSLLIILTAGLAYRWQISPELNEQLHALLHRVRL